MAVLAGLIAELADIYLKDGYAGCSKGIEIVLNKRVVKRFESHRETFFAEFFICTP